jgi:uncharacterized membrane protein
VVLTNTIGNYALAVGMKSAPPDAGPILSLLEPAVLAGIVLLIVWTLLRLQLLKRADLTFVLPVTAVGYVLNAWMGAVFLHEHVSAQRWAGTLLIVAGAALTGVGAAKTEPPR